ncbi:D-alanyl-D-alanine carboxypeptidase [Streptomyces sp. IB2014 016-6]|nr:D-alanyl-D-alanine carboxypeptidase [Streptomyces sp. IB2014 016-6]TXL84644.1 D-alanyl-D-alanine carboxypeptidase [Streptomyces sp. IB2014 016-6]
MAGESPDKSEQRKSSGEATHERDPRFAVFRESAADEPDATKDASSDREGSPEAAVDHSTAVFTVRGAGGAPEAPGAAEAPVAAVEGSSAGATESEPESRTEPESESAAEPESGSGVTATPLSDLRPAAEKPADEPETAPVPAADVAPANPEGEREAEPAGSARPVGGRSVSGSGGDGVSARPADESEGGSARSAAAVASAEPENGSDAAPAASGAKPGAEPEGKPEVEAAASGSDRPADVASAKQEAGAGRKADGESVRPAAPGSRLGSTPAASESTADAKPDTAAEADVASAEPEGEPAGSADGSGSARPVGGRSVSGSGGDGVSARPADESEGGSARSAAAVASAEPENGSDAAPALSGAKPGAEPEVESAGSGNARPAGVAPAEPDAPAAPGAAPGAKPAGGSGVNFRRPSVAPAEPEGTSGQKPAAVDVTSAKAQTAPEASPEGGVDRQTAVFKALKRPGVDQPTAMLKLPPQTPAPASELPAERTSKFVPLRSEQAQQPASAGVAEAERTRQQPMPPLPPLDLLAELTNKPAPPETPTRTVVRRVKIWTPLLVLVLIIFAVVQAVRPLPEPSLNLTAESTYTFEGDKPTLPWPGEGQGFMAATGLGTVDSFGEQKAVPIGSVAKAMTAYVVLKDKPLAKGADGPSITVDAKAEEDGGLDAQGESTLNTVKEGDKLTQHDALAALMIPSANNIARLLARWNTDGSEEAFVKKMNDTAEELGMKNTTYTDPSGLDATTVSSAEDQVKLGQKLVEIEALMDITKLPEWKDPSGKTWRNYNTLVPYDGALGIKTGSTTKAGGNLLFAAHKTVGDTDQLIVGAVLGQHKAPIIDTVNAVSEEVMLATQDELEGATVVKKGQVVGEFDNNMGTKTPVVATKDVKAVGWSGLTVKLELSDEGKDLPQSAAAGTHVGLLTVGEGKSRVEVAVALQGDLAEPTFGDKLTRVG